jgi:1,4-alpha-glucan branching enzyme
MLVKKFTKTKCKVSFELSADQLHEGVTVEKINVVGDFNGWNPETTPMKKGTKNAPWKVSVDLELNQKYAFRYFINDGQWHDESQADEYAANDMGSQNCIVSTHQG